MLAGRSQRRGARRRRLPTKPELGGCDASRRWRGPCGSRRARTAAGVSVLALGCCSCCVAMAASADTRRSAPEKGCQVLTCQTGRGSHRVPLQGTHGGASGSAAHGGFRAAADGIAQRLRGAGRRRSLRLRQCFAVRTAVAAQGRASRVREGASSRSGPLHAATPAALRLWLLAQDGLPVVVCAF